MLDLELTINRTGEQATAALRVELPSRRADLADGVPLTLDETALCALSLIPDGYGAALTAMVFVPALREAWQRALGFAEGQNAMLRVRLHLRGDDALHALRWELLRDPVTNTPLAHRERIAFSRFLSSDHLGDLHAATRPQLRALVAVADAAGPGMAPVDVVGEVARAQAGLSNIPVTILDGRDGRPSATLAHLADVLRSGPHILLLTCHGRLVEGQPFLYLAGDDPYRPTPGAELIRQLADLCQRPLLVILATCQSGGDGAATLAAIGPQLARVGIGAVIAMQGDVPMDLVAALMPRLFSELRRDGQIDRALAAARAALPADSPWWQPVLWMAVKDGALWQMPAASARAGVRRARWPALLAGAGGAATVGLLGAAGLAPLLAAMGAGALATGPVVAWLTSMGMNALAGWVGNLAADGMRAALAANEPDSAWVAALGQRLDAAAAADQALAGELARLLTQIDAVPQALAALRLELSDQTEVLLAQHDLLTRVSADLERLHLTSGALGPVLTQETNRVIAALEARADRTDARIDQVLAAVAALRDGARWRTPEAASVRGAGVFQVPYPPNPHFRGRDVELAALAEVLLGDTSGIAAVLPAVSGTGGIGKTQLASEFAHAYADQFPGGVFWLAMEQSATVASQVAAAGGPGGLDLPDWSGLAFKDQVAAVKRAWSDPVCRLLVFDNLEDPTLLTAWRPTSGGTRVLITTRRGVWASSSGVRPVPIQTLARPESVRLLLIPRYGDQVEAVLADPEVALEADVICAQVGDLPLALALAGAYLEQTPSLSLAGYRTRLAAMLLRHPSLDAELEEGLPTQHVESVAATIALSYERLDTTKATDALAIQVLQRIAQLAPALIPKRLLVRLAERDPDDEYQAAEVDAPLRRLAAVGLVDLLSEGGASMHRLVAAFVRDQDAEAAAHTTHAAAGLISEVDAINRAGYPQRGQPYLVHLQAFATGDERLEAEQQAMLCGNLGYLLRAQGDLAGARLYLERALAITEALGPTHPDTATSLNNLGNLLQAQGDLAGARLYLERALAITEQVLGPEHPDTARSLNNLGSLLQAQGVLAGARLYYERALHIREQVLGPTHPTTATSLNNLGALLHVQGDLVGARPHVERALAITEQALGPEHPDTATSLNNLGNLLQAQGDLAGARLYYERVLAITEQVLGPAHPDTARSLNNLGALLQAQGDLVGARPHVERALAIREQALEPTHPDTARSLNNLGALLHGMGDLAGGRSYYERALAIWEQVLGPTHPDTARSVGNLGALLQAQGDLAEARLYYERALAIREQALGPTHPDTATSLNNLAINHYYQDDLPTAERLMRRALQIREVRLGSDHPNTQSSRQILAIVQQRIRDAALPPPSDPLERFGPLLAAIAAVATGDDRSRPQVSQALAELEQHNCMLREPVERIWQGERDRDALVAGLDAQDTAIIERILALITSTSQPPRHRRQESHPCPIDPSSPASW